MAKAWPPRLKRGGHGRAEEGALEEDFRGELDLPCRAGIASREPRIADDPERRAANSGGAARLPEVGLIEQVENLEAKLDARAALERHVLDDREVGIAE